MDAQLVTKIVFGVVGGLGIFLLGMKNMSEGMQAVAGRRLRKLINAVTNNRLLACSVGAIITCLIQSSSVTTVMVVGMVNAGLMTLMQAIGVILGANIGTTITGWILVLKVGKYGLPLLGVSALFYLFSRRDKIRYTAALFLGLGMVFFGLQLMKGGFEPLKEMPEFLVWFSRFSPDSYFGVLRCCLVGAALTAIVQSSSATIGITMGLAFNGIIDFPTAAALVLGENIGTTITAYLASLGASSNARRASYAHMLINVIGVLWITALFAFYIKAVAWFVGTDPGTAIIMDGKTTYPFILKGIAVTHTGFNVVNVIIFLPFIAFLSKLLNRLVPEKTYKEKSHLTYLDVRMLDTPAISIEQSQKEILLMGNKTVEMLGLLRTVLAEQKPDEEREGQIFDYEDSLDLIQKEVVEFLSNLMSGNIAHSVANAGRRQLRMADEYESISDYITAVLKLNLKMRDANQQMSEQGHKEILELHDQVAVYISFINEAVRQESKEILSKARARGNNITRVMKECRTTHLARVGTGSTTPLKSLIYTDMLNSYRRIKDHALNIAEVLAGEK